MATVKQIAAMSAAERDAANQAQLAKLTSVPCTNAEAHSAVLKSWSTKLCGPKPTAEMVKLNYIIDAGRRAGVEVLWLAMTLRPDGATVGEYMRATSAGGAAHNNAAKYNTERNGAGWFVRVPLPNSERAGRWQHVITDKGITQLDKRIAALSGVETKPVKAAKPVKVKAKANKAKAKPVMPEATPEAETVDVPSLPATPEALADLQAHFSK